MLENISADDEEPTTLVRFREAAGRWARGGVGADETIMLACDLLVDGCDTPALRDLASLPVSSGWWESRDVLKATIEELGYDFAALDGEESRLLSLRLRCLAFLRGDLAEESFLRIAWMFEGNPPVVARDLAYLVYLFDADEIELDATEAAELTALATSYARAFLAATTNL